MDKENLENIKREIEDDESDTADDGRLSDSQMEVEDSDQVQELGPAVLGLQRVGSQPPSKPKPTPAQPVQVLNRRGMPARIRKKNKLFFDEDMVNHPPHR